MVKIFKRSLDMRIGSRDMLALMALFFAVSLLVPSTSFSTNEEEEDAVQASPTGGQTPVNNKPKWTSPQGSNTGNLYRWYGNRQATPYLNPPQGPKDPRTPTTNPAMNHGGWQSQSRPPSIRSAPVTNPGPYYRSPVAPAGQPIPYWQSQMPSQPPTKK
jgi:hypothetical protein